MWSSWQGLYQQFERLKLAICMHGGDAKQTFESCMRGRKTTQQKQIIAAVLAGASWPSAALAACVTPEQLSAWLPLWLKIDQLVKTGKPN